MAFGDLVRKPIEVFEYVSQMGLTDALKTAAKRNNRIIAVWGQGEKEPNEEELRQAFIHYEVWRPST